MQCGVQTDASHVCPSPRCLPVSVAWHTAASSSCSASGDAASPAAPSVADVRQVQLSGRGLYRWSFRLTRLELPPQRWLPSERRPEPAMKLPEAIAAASAGPLERLLHDFVEAEPRLQPQRLVAKGEQFGGPAVPDCWIAYHLRVLNRTLEHVFLGNREDGPGVMTLGTGCPWGPRRTARFSTQPSSSTGSCNTIERTPKLDSKAINGNLAALKSSICQTSVRAAFRLDRLKDIFSILYPDSKALAGRTAP
ncbi:uncharacterized protein LOC144180662 [Haemaphysalis longicornis]